MSASAVASAGPEDRRCGHRAGDSGTKNGAMQRRVIGLRRGKSSVRPEVGRRRRSRLKIPEAIASARVVVLTGAGASVPLGLFTTRQFLDDLRVNDYQRLSQQGLEATLSWVLSEATTKEFDIEDVLDLLERRRDACRLLLADGRFVQNVQQHRVSQAEGYLAETEQVITAIRDKVVDHYSSVEPSLAAELYRPMLREFRAWFSRIPELGYTLPLFTLNYDTSVELAANRLAEAPIEQDGQQLPVRLVDGLLPSSEGAERRWSRQAFEGYTEKSTELGAVLVKLHGSVRWGRDSRPGKEELIVELATGVGRDPGRFHTAILYPTLAPKPVNEEPFRTGYRLLRACLRGTRFFVVIGCSLRDPELVAEIRDAMEENEGLHLVSVGPTVDHAGVCQALSLNSGRDRVAALRAEFAIPKPQIESTYPGGILPREWLMGCLRRLALEAYAVEGVSYGSFFGQTQICDRQAGLGSAPPTPT
jgi:hypothetical protein